MWEHFRHQRHGTYCGLATTAIVLSTINGNTVDENQIVEIGKISEESNASIRVKGLTLPELYDILQKVELVKSEVKMVHGEDVADEESLRD